MARARAKDRDGQVWSTLIKIRFIDEAVQVLYAMRCEP